MGAIQQMFLCRGGLSAFRYYRMLITANNGDASFTNVSEVQMRGTIGGADLIPALAGPDARVLFSSENGANPAWRVYDGNLSGTPWVTASGGAVPSYIGWDFTTATTVAQFAYCTASGSPANRAPASFVFEGSQDNITYTPIISQSGQVASPGVLLLFSTGL